jgi:hypothetical protein
MENNQDSRFNRGRVIYRPRKKTEIIEDETEPYPEDLKIQEEQQDLPVQNTDEPCEATEKNEEFYK